MSTAPGFLLIYDLFKRSHHFCILRDSTSLTPGFVLHFASISILHDKLFFKMCLTSTMLFKSCMDAFISFSSLITVARRSSTMLNESG